MACRNRKLVFKVLTGELASAKSTEMLEHFRVCGECREAFDFAAKTITSTGARVAHAPHHAGDDPAPSSRWRAAWSPVKRNRRTAIVFGAAIVALMVAGIGRGRAGGEVAEPPAEVFLRRALADGTPVVHAPSGAFDSRPRVVVALLPVGSSQAKVTVVDEDGSIIFEKQAKPGVEGCFVEETSIDAPGGRFVAGRLLFPFPDEAALPLAPGRAYGVVVSVAGGHCASSAVFQVRPPDGLHGGAEEKR